jgi:hypothetical protein
MNDFLDNLTSFWWWFSVVVVGLAVNLAAAYLKPQLDKYMSGHFESRRRRMDAVSKARSERIAAIRESERAFHLAIRREHGWWLWAILLFALSAVILLTTNALKLAVLSAIGNLLAVILIFLGINSMRSAVRVGSEIDEATSDG